MWHRVRACAYLQQSCHAVGSGNGENVIALGVNPREGQLRRSAAPALSDIQASARAHAARLQAAAVQQCGREVAPAMAARDAAHAVVLTEKLSAVK